MLEFEVIFSQLEMLSLRAIGYLVDVRVEWWAQSHYNGKIYNIMTTRIVECMNVVLKNVRARSSSCANG